MNSLDHVLKYVLVVSAYTLISTNNDINFTLGVNSISGILGKNFL